MQDPLVIHDCPITRSRSKRVKEALMSLVADIQVNDLKTIEDLHLIMLIRVSDLR